MISFPSFENVENMGGNADTFLFIPVSQIVSMPKPLNGVISQEIWILSQSSWYTGRALPGSLEFDEKQSPVREGHNYSSVFKGVIPKLTSTYLALFEEMACDLFVVIFTDNNGNRHVMGTENEGASFEYDRNTTSTPSGLAGHRFEFSCARAKPSPFYSV